MTRLAIFDYGAGNLHSLSKAISVEGVEVTIEADIRAAMEADVLVLPGVGAFGAAINALDGAQVDLASALSDGLPCVGICLGMQLLFDASEESSGFGIGLIPGCVRKLRTTKVPHMGWNEIEWRNGGVGERAARLETAYFANSYICESEDESKILAWTTHQNARFPSVVRKANTIGVQFHPEKSSATGRAFVNTLIEELIECR